MNNPSHTKAVEAADLLNRALRKLLTGEQGIHAETVIAAAARLAGTLLLRDLVPSVDQMEPGTAVLSDAADQQGPQLLELVFATLRQLGHADLDASTLGGHEETTALSRLSLAQTQSLFSPWCEKIAEVTDLSRREMAAAAAVTTAMLIHDCREVLNIHAGCAIAVYGIVEAIKTVPLIAPATD